MGRAFLLVLALLLPAFVGCIQAPSDDSNAASVKEPASRTGGTMSGVETTDQKSGPCDAAQLLGQSNNKFCATRIVTVKGALSGFAALDVALETFNGDITIKPGNEGSWQLVATMVARGDSEAAANERLTKVSFSWAHETPRGHLVEARASHDGKVENTKAEIELLMPRSLLMTIVAQTSNGDVILDGSKSDGLALSTSNGDVVARGEATQTSLSTSNGDIEVALTPLGPARWSFSTSNGDVDVKVPEGAAYGYSFEGTTSNGEVEYDMRDGEKGPCPQGSEYYTPPCNHRTFETNSFQSREKRVTGTFSTSNGEISVAAK